MPMLKVDKHKAGVQTHSGFLRGGDAGEIMAKVKISPERVLQELAAIGFAEATDFLYVQDNELFIRPTEELSKKNRAAIASVEKTSNGIRVKLYDKMKALELLGKLLKMFDDRDMGQQTEENNLLEAILAATREEMDTHDIPEIQQAADPGDDLVEQTGT